MPAFETPEPITVNVELGIGDIRIVASERDDTVVDVRPSDPERPSDVTAAAQTRVEFSGGRLLVKAPRGLLQWASRRGDSVDVRIELPAGSHVRGSAGLASLRCSGRVGDCSYKTGVGDVQIEEAGSVNLKTGVGDITVERVSGTTDVVAASGKVAISRVGGSAVVRNSNGDTWIGEVGGEARVKAANGKISIDRAMRSVEAKTANGDVHLREVLRGRAVAHSALGTVNVGVGDGVAAWLDLDTRFGNVRNELVSSDRPGLDEDSVEISAHTGFGDINVHRSSETVSRRDG